jgi:hypothetical protein
VGKQGQYVQLRDASGRWHEAAPRIAYVGGRGYVAFYVSTTPAPNWYDVVVMIETADLAAAIAAGSARLVEGSAEDRRGGHDLHVELGRAGIPSKEHAAYASRVLGKPVARLRNLTPAERNRVRAEIGVGVA